MDNKKSALQKAKIFQAVLGLFLLLPPVLGVIFFVISVFGGDGRVPQMRNLRDSWVADWGYSGDGGGGGMSAAPVYLGLMALAGCYLIKDSLQYLFTDDK